MDLLFCNFRTPASRPIPDFWFVVPVAVSSFLRHPTRLSDIMGSSLPVLAVILLAVTRIASGFAFIDRMVLPATVQRRQRGNQTPRRSRRAAHHHTGLLKYRPSCISVNADNNKSDSVDREVDSYREAVLGESERRGNILFAASLILVLWSFSLPLDLRRTHWCFIESCVQDRASCYNCLTFEEWCQKVLDFYQTTPASGWVSFDFTTVDPNFVWSVERLSSGSGG